MPFEPIAIVGRACVLPGALSPQAFWQALHDGRDLIGPVPDGFWRLDPARVVAASAAEPAACDRGGYVSGFEAVFDPERYDLPRETIDGLDPLFQWLLHVSAESLREAGLKRGMGARTGLVAGNLSYPSHGLNRFAEAVWLECQGIGFLDGRAMEVAGLDLPSPINRFMSGHPAQLAARALGLGGEAFCLDAACASALYALKAACERLHERAADAMIAAAVNRADDLFLHVGFTALQALSRSGQSRPFHRDADGLLPAEGAAAVVLMRLTDAVESGARIFGVIRGIGLSNDGRSRGFLVPEASAQERAMRAAYAVAELAPADVSLVECHATGTSVGDAEEIRAMNRVFAGMDDLPVGSHKSNIGHSITASGMAGLLKILGAMEAEIRPPSLHVEAPLNDFADGPLRPLTVAEPWTARGPRRAGLSGFGFGGNNAHLIVEEYRKATHLPRSAKSPTPPMPVAVVAFGAAFGDAAGGPEFVRRLLDKDAATGPHRATQVEIPLDDARFPPADLQKALAQQTLMLAAALQAVGGLKPNAEARWGTIVGMGCDPEISRHGLRWRLAEWAERWRAAGFETDADWAEAARDAVIEPLDAARVIGTMPNVVANRLNRQFDWNGFGYTVSAEELSGMVAFRAAVRALREGEIDAALVGAVDVGDDPVHRAAMSTIGKAEPGDGAVALIVKRLADAERNGDPILAVFDGTNAGADQVLAMSDDSPVLQRFGHVHAASGLLHLAAGVIACAGRVRVADAAPWLPSPAGRRVQIAARSFGGQTDSLTLHAHPGAVAPISTSGPIPHIAFHSGTERTNLREGEGHGPVRMAVIAPDADSLRERTDAALAGQAGVGAFIADAPIGGETAFAFTGAAAAYHGMGRDLLLAMPELADGARARLPSMAEAAAWVHADPPPASVSPFDQLKGCTVLAQVHAELTRGLLGIRPDAVLGLSSGETNGILAMGAWRDGDALFAEIERSGMYGRELTGECRTWTRSGRAEWKNWRILAPLEAVRAALTNETTVRLTIVNAPDDAVIGGDATACRRVVEAVGTERCLPLGHDMVVHCPELGPFAETWRRIHARETHAVADIRFYANAIGGAYAPDRESVADMLTGQALDTVDFPRTVEAAWRDGVRVFIEHGPRGTLSAAIDRILGDREHVAVALDRARTDGLPQLFEAVARLFVAGVPMDAGAFRRRMDAARRRPTARARRLLRLPVHRPPVRFPSLAGAETDIEAMPPAPPLPPVADLPPIAPLAPETRVAVMAAPPCPGIAPIRNTTPRAPSPAMPVAAPIAADTARNFLSQVADMHAAFLAEQAAMHRRFLELMQRTAGGVVPSPAPIPIPDGVPPETKSTVVFGRADLEALASGRISSVFGPTFERQDGYAKQVRMPMPPLLLADRVTALEGEAGSMGLGVIETETDVPADAWYLHHGAMPPGLMIESGTGRPAADFPGWGSTSSIAANGSTGLLGCELTFHGGLPKPGRHAALRYPCRRPRQAGRRAPVSSSITTAGSMARSACRCETVRPGSSPRRELANSGGVLWDPEQDTPRSRRAVRHSGADQPRTAV